MHTQRHQMISGVLLGGCFNRGFVLSNLLSFCQSFIVLVSRDLFMSVTAQPAAQVICFERKSVIGCYCVCFFVRCYCCCHHCIHCVLAQTRGTTVVGHAVVHGTAAADCQGSTSFPARLRLGGPKTLHGQRGPKFTWLTTFAPDLVLQDREIQ